MQVHGIFSSFSVCTNYYLLTISHYYLTWNIKSNTVQLCSKMAPQQVVIRLKRFALTQRFNLSDIFQ